MAEKQVAKEQFGVLVLSCPADIMGVIEGINTKRAPIIVPFEKGSRELLKLKNFGYRFVLMKYVSNSQSVALMPAGKINTLVLEGKLYPKDKENFIPKEFLPKETELPPKEPEGPTPEELAEQKKQEEEAEAARLLEENKTKLEELTSVVEANETSLAGLQSELEVIVKEFDPANANKTQTKAFEKDKASLETKISELTKVITDDKDAMVKLQEAING